MTRREILSLGAAGVLRPAAAPATRFQIGCMTIVYSAFPVERALKGIAGAGYRYVGWGTTHPDAAGRRAPIIAPDAPSSEARELAGRCRGEGLTPVMMFAQVYVAAPDSIKVHTRRIEQASAAGIPFIITFGKVDKSAGADYGTWVRNLKQLGPVARDAGVTLVLKQHGGETSTGRDCARILADVSHENVKMCYDAGNVLDYESQDPIPDIQACWRDVRAFAIKDHRKTPKNQDCGPGFGEIDHYKLLAPVMQTGLSIPLVCENIFAPLVPRPTAPEGVDALARRAREYLETVIEGLRA